MGCVSLKFVRKNGFKNANKGNISILILCAFLTCSGCNNEYAEKTVPNTFVNIKPAYSDIQFLPGQDTLHFPLTEDTYNEIKSFNYFTQNNRSFISFYDRRSESVLIYDFSSHKRINKIMLKKVFHKLDLFKVSVFVKDFDSILVTNLDKLHLLDSSGKIRTTISFFDRSDAMATLQSETPPVFINNLIYTGVRSYINEKSISAIRKWRTLYSFDLKEGTRQLNYPVPDIYTKHLYGDLFFDYSYCVNDKGHFVFSFPADSCIYETDLVTYQHAYIGKSNLQNKPIDPVAKEMLDDDDEAFKQYMLRDSYGAIYYDPGKKRYLRLAKHRLTEEEWAAGRKSKKSSVVILNQDFQIIGEADLDKSFSFGSLFFTQDGKIYARILSKDEYAIHFVKVNYVE